MTVIATDWMFVLDAIEAETGVRPTIQTASKLIRNGHLEARKVLGRWQTTREKVKEYAERQTELAMAGRSPKQLAHQTRTHNRSKRAVELENRQLDALGIKHS